MRRRVMVLGLLAIASVAVAALTARAQEGGGGHGPMALSYSVTRLADAVRAPASTFQSVAPACSCTRRTDIAQFSLRTGRRMRLLARIRTGGRLSGAVSDRRGDLWMTFTAGPRLSAPGTSGGGPEPGTCASALVRYDPYDGRVTTVRRFPPGVTIGTAVPSPNGRRVAVIEGGCASAFLNEHLVVIGARGTTRISIGAAATPCHDLTGAAWNPAGNELVFPYGPSKLRPGTHFIPRGTCTAPAFDRLAVVSARHSSDPAGWHLWRAQPHCSYSAAAFAGTGEGGPGGVIATEVCTARVSPGSDTLGRASLVQLGRRGRVTHRWSLPRAWDGGDVVADPASGEMLISEYQAANAGVRPYDWVWALHGLHLRVVERMRFPDAPYFDAQPL